MEIRIAPFNKELPFIEPKNASKGAAGWDLYASIGKGLDITILPGEVKLIDTNVSIAVPHGYEAQIRSRSGLAYKNGIFVLNSPGCIDSDYRGPMGVILANFGKELFVVNDGMRIAQMIISDCTSVDFILTDTLQKTERGDGGFGSTGSQ